MPHEEGTVPSTRTAVRELNDGMTDAGTDSFAVQFVDPMSVLPL